MVTDAQKWLQDMVGERSGFKLEPSQLWQILTCQHLRACSRHQYQPGGTHESVLQLALSGNSELPITNKGTVGAAGSHPGYLRFAAGPYAHAGM